MRALACLLAQQRSVTGPAVRFGHRFITVVDELMDAFFEVFE